MKNSIKQLDPIDLEWGKVCIEFYADLMPELGGGRGGVRRFVVLVKIGRILLKICVVFVSFGLI